MTVAICLWPRPSLSLLLLIIVYLSTCVASQPTAAIDRDTDNKNINNNNNNNNNNNIIIAIEESNYRHGINANIDTYSANKNSNNNNNNHHRNNEIRRALALRHHSPSRPHPKVYWINLDASQSRKVYMEREFATLGIENQRVSGVQATSFDELRANISRLELPCRRNTPRDISCALSHIKALHACLDDSAYSGDYCIIMEDDVKLLYLVDFDKLIASAPKPFGVLQLGSSNPETIVKHYFAYDPHNISTYFSPNKWDMKTKKQGYALYWSAQYYLVNRTLLRERLPLLFDYIDPNKNNNNNNNNKNRNSNYGYHSSFGYNYGGNGNSNINMNLGNKAGGGGGGGGIMRRSVPMPDPARFQKMQSQINIMNNMNNMKHTPSSVPSTVTAANNNNNAIINNNGNFNMNSKTNRRSLRDSASTIDISIYNPDTQGVITPSARRRPSPVHNSKRNSDNNNIKTGIKQGISTTIASASSATIITEANSNNSPNSDSLGTGIHPSSTSWTWKTLLYRVFPFLTPSNENESDVVVLRKHNYPAESTETKQEKIRTNSDINNNKDDADGISNINSSNNNNNNNKDSYNSTSNANLILRYKLINSFFPESCHFTKEYPCVLANCLFSDTYVYSLLSPTYVSSIPLVVGAKIGLDSDLHQDHVYIHKLAFKIIHLMHDIMKNTSLSSIPSESHGNITQTPSSPTSTSSSSLPDPTAPKTQANADDKAPLIINLAQGEYLSRLVNFENYKDVITSKGRTSFPSYIVSTIET